MDILIIIIKAIASDETAMELRPTFCERLRQARSPSPPNRFLQNPRNALRARFIAEGDSSDTPRISRKTERKPKNGKLLIGGGYEFEYLEDVGNGTQLTSNPSNERTTSEITSIFLRDDDESLEQRERFESLSQILIKMDIKPLEIYTEGKTKLGRIIDLIYLLDYVSLYLAILKDIDPTPTPNIDEIKKLLKNRFKEIN